MKACNMCQRVLPLTEFSRDARLSDGHRNDCKECLKKIRNQPENKDREMLWQRRQIGKYAETRRKYREAHRKEENTKMRIHYKKRRKKNFAGGKIHREIQAGRMIRPEKCQECGVEGNIQGHHEDYDKPLEVIWLCPRCHKNKHLLPLRVSNAS